MSFLSAIINPNMLKVGFGIGALFGAKKGLNALATGTSLTNPLFPQRQPMQYGKRGIDANTGNTDGLVQSLHTNRRKY